MLKIAVNFVVQIVFQKIRQYNTRKILKFDWTILFESLQIKHLLSNFYLNVFALFNAKNNDQFFVRIFLCNIFFFNNFVTAELQDGADHTGTRSV